MQFVKSFSEFFYFFSVFTPKTAILTYKTVKKQTFCKFCASLPPFYRIFLNYLHYLCIMSVSIIRVLMIDIPSNIIIRLCGRMCLNESPYLFHPDCITSRSEKSEDPFPCGLGCDSHVAQHFGLFSLFFSSFYETTWEKRGMFPLFSC